MENKIFKAINLKVNMCDHCIFTIPTCDGDALEFGTGQGNDNVTACDAYSGFIKEVNVD